MDYKIGYAVRYETLDENGERWMRYTQKRDTSKDVMADYEALQDPHKANPVSTYWNSDWKLGPTSTPAQLETFAAECCLSNCE